MGGGDAMLKKILTTSEYLHKGTYIPQKNDRDGDPRDIFQGGGEARCGFISLFWVSNSKSEEGGAYQIF